MLAFPSIVFLANPIRYWFKQKDSAKGKLFTGGLFSLSRNPNYLGDVINFSGLAMSTHTWWPSWIPLVMLLGFIFHHIPEKEAYLAERYESEWPAYSKRVKALVPGVW